MSKLNFDNFQKPLHTRDIFNQGMSLGGDRSALRTVAVVFMVFITACVLFSALIAAASAPGQVGVWIGICVLIGILVLIGWVAVQQALKKAARAIRLKAFAEANHFAFTPAKPAGGYPGTLFSLGRDQQFLSVVDGTYQNMTFEFGNFYCTMGSGKSSHTRAFGVIEVKLPRKLPHILLDSRKNNRFGMSHLSLFSTNQKLQLEGNFNNYFDLYVPKGYERDALYFLTPELMALLIDHGAEFDVEIVDNHLFVYASKEFDLQYEQTVRSIFQLITVLGGEIHENTARYADARVGDRQANIVAEQGKRLKRSVSLLIIFTIIFFAVFGWLWWRQITTQQL